MVRPHGRQQEASRESSDRWEGREDIEIKMKQKSNAQGTIQFLSRACDRSYTRLDPAEASF